MRASYTIFYERQRLMKRDNRMCECGHKFLYHDVKNEGKTECLREHPICSCIGLKKIKKETSLQS